LDQAGGLVEMAGTEVVFRGAASLDMMSVGGETEVFCRQPDELIMTFSWKPVGVQQAAHAHSVAELRHYLACAHSLDVGFDGDGGGVRWKGAVHTKANERHEDRRDPGSGTESADGGFAHQARAYRHERWFVYQAGT
jgi:hypothetical protein